MAANATTSDSSTLNDDALLDTALTLIAAAGWRRFSLQAMAAEAGVPMARIAERFPDRVSVVEAVVERTDALMLADVTAADEVEPHRDRLFDLMMRRLDVLAPHKAAVAAIASAAPFDPELGWRLGWQLRRSLRRTLEAAGIATAGLRGQARVQGLAAISAWVLRTWLTDDSPDLGPTMKALDTALDRADAMEQNLSRLVPFAGPGMRPRPASSESRGPATGGDDAPSESVRPA
jgi:AcrR family transcriptional regulator